MPHIWNARSWLATSLLATVLVACRQPDARPITDGGVATDAGTDAGVDGGSDAGTPMFPSYVPHDRGPGRCFAVNDQGDAVGTDPSGAAFLFKASGERVALGLSASALQTEGLAINGHGVIAGVGVTASSRGAVQYSAGAWSTPSGLAPGWSVANAVNDSGVIAGAMAVGGAGSPHRHAFLLSGGQSQDLGTLGGPHSSANAVSSNGLAAGVAQTSSEDTHAFLFASGTMQDLGTLGGKGSAAYGVNARGWVVGVAETSAGVGHAFLYDGTLRDLNVSGVRSDARGVSDEGVIAGNWIADNGRAVPFFWMSGAVQVLPTPPTLGWDYGKVESVSPGGVIVGWGVLDGVVDAGPHCLVWERP